MMHSESVPTIEFVGTGTPLICPCLHSTIPTSCLYFRVVPSLQRCSYIFTILVTQYGSTVYIGMAMGCSAL